MAKARRTFHLDLGEVAGAVHLPRNWRSFIGSVSRADCADLRRKLDCLELIAGGEQGRKFIVAVLAGTRLAQERFEALRTGRRGFVLRQTGSGVRLAEVENPNQVRRPLADELRLLARAGSVNHARAELLRRRLCIQKEIDDEVRAFLLDKKTQPNRLYLKLGAKALVDYFRHVTGKPHYRLVGWLMLKAGILDGRGELLLWEVHGRRAEGYVRQLVRR